MYIYFKQYTIIMVLIFCGSKISQKAVFDIFVIISQKWSAHPRA